MSDLTERVKAATAQDEEPETAGGEVQPQGGNNLPDLAAGDPMVRWLGQYTGHLDLALPRHIDRQHFMAVAWSAMHKLRNCTPQSIGMALLACARFGLVPDGKQAAIVPYNGTATFQPMYQGYIELMYRSGRVESVHFGWIHEADVWDYEPTAPPPHDFVHKPRVDLPKKDRGPVILAYAFAWLRGGGRSQVILLNRHDAQEIRDEHSRAYANAERKRKYDSAWHTNFDDMWAKSCVLRLEKRVPSSTELADLVRADAGMTAVRFVPPAQEAPGEEEAQPGGDAQAEELWGLIVEAAAQRGDDEGQAAAAFTSWSGGVHPSTATPARLRAYLALLDGDQE